MNISPLFLAIRAISAEFAQRIFAPTIYIVGGALLVLIGISIWLVTISGWWWWLLAPLILLSVLFIFAVTIAGLIIRLLRPQQTKTQRGEVRSFVDALQGTSEAIQTPKFILLFRLVKDILFPTEKGLVQELSGNASTLKNGLKTLVASFQDNSR